MNNGINNMMLAFGASFFGSLFALIVFEAWSVWSFRKVEGEKHD